MIIIFSKLLFAFLTAFYGLWLTYDKTVTRPNVTGFNRFWSVAVRLWVYYHIRQPVAVPVPQNWAEKPDWTGLLNTNHAGPERTQTLINQSRTRVRHSPYGHVSKSASVSIPITDPVEDSGCTLPVNVLATTAATVQRTLNFPISGVLVPDLGHSSGAWKRAIKQWEEYDPTTKCALKDWPKDWYTGVMRQVGALQCTGSSDSRNAYSVSHGPIHGAPWILESYLYPE